MDRVVRRNSIMFRLSIIALVMYVLYIGYMILIAAFGLEVDQWKLHSSTASLFASVALLIGYIAVYVLWTPYNEIDIRKRPTWQFVLLLITIFIPMIQGMLYNYAGIEWGTMMVRVASYSFENSSGDMYRSISFTDLLTPLWSVMIIILLIKCERKAKKILITYLTSNFISIVLYVTKILVFKTEYSRVFDEILYKYIYQIYPTVIHLLLLIFTIIYTRQKYKEASLLNEQRRI